MNRNRVDPFGNIIETAARGTWLGNRGQLHGTGKTILRQFKHKAWIICQLQFKNRHRLIMTPNLWTELFFLDEATALSAGHRPCFECRRAAAVRFKEAWIRGNPEYGFDMKTPIGKIDDILHQERIVADGSKVTFECKLQELPSGTFIDLRSTAYLVKNEMIHKWSPFGYDSGIACSPSQMVRVLTPKSMLNAIREGYSPQSS